MVKINEKIIIDLEPISRRVYLFEDKSIYEILVKIGIPIRSLCGGSGSCGKCKILFQKGHKYLNSPTDSERNLLNNDDIKKGWRLACESRIDKAYIQTLEKETSPPQFRIYLPNELVLEDFKILTSGINKDLNLNPNIKKLYIEVDNPSLENPVTDIERILTSIIYVDENIEKNDLIAVDFDLLKNLSQILRYSNHKITVVIWNNNTIIGAEPGNTTEDNFGIAIDIGTTTLVGYLMNLNNGKTYSVASKLNGQTAFGEDLITRISYIKENEDGLQKLNSVVINNLNDIILKTCSKANINPSQIYEIVVVGNSVMHHIFLGLTPVNIGLSPYVPIVRNSLNIKSKDLHINISNQGKVYTLPLIAGFVGADTMGVIISSKIEDEHSLTLAIDIGTNGEIIIGNNEILATASCAAGSALEGAHIEDGMRAAAGSIDSIKINPETLDVSYTTIKNKKPMGICGSGLIDAVAEMLKAKILNRSGNFNKKKIDHKRMFKDDKGLGFILAKKDETNLNKAIKISQHDIRELQMAKAAFYSGMRIILRYLNKSLNKNLKIEQVFLAGAFGNYINKENAKFIGMIPDIPRENIFQIGNAAGMGAQNCLLNKDLRKKAEELYKKIQYIEIATKKEFQKEYAEAMYFPHMKLSDFFPSLKEYEDIAIR